MIVDKRKICFAFLVYFVVGGIVSLTLRSNEPYAMILLQCIAIAIIGSGIYAFQHRRDDGFEK